jgi:predicted regulator of Ras-like GTPase activity (Roadblock/LC7/MglB family)
MATLPQLIEDDIQRLNGVLGELLGLSDATTALVLDKGGFIITQTGDTQQFDLTTIGALASGAYLANQTIAGLVREENFNSVYQQGQNYSILTMNVNENALLVIIFAARISVGAVKYFAARVSTRIAEVMNQAWQRTPAGGGLDLSELNLEKTDVVFRKQS